MSYKNLVIKKIENFFSTTVNGIPQQTKPELIEQQTTNYNFRYYKSHGFPHLHRCRSPQPKVAQASHTRA